MACPRILRTLVAVPTLLTTVEAIEEQIERLEVHHLASPDGDLHFALLSDWLDAATEHVDGDEALLEAAIAGIARLNRRYGPAPGGDRFLLLHRRRVWNEGEARWIGWERKRGKLHELNRLLRGATDTSFLRLGGQPPKVPAGVRYVITLDADTRLPRDTVRRLIGKMAHPLNRPRFDAAAGRVVEGYARAAAAGHAVAAGRPRGFAVPAHLFQHERHRSLCRRRLRRVPGSVRRRLYAGKGIYDIDAFEAALAGRVPGLDAAQPRSVRGHLRPRRSRLRYRGRRGIPRPLRRRRAAPPPLGARRLAVAAVDIRARAGRRHGSADAAPCRRSAAGRCSTICGEHCRHRPACCRLAGGIGVAVRLPRRCGPASSSSTIVLPALIPVIGAIVPRRAGITPRSHLGALGADLRLALAQSALIVTFLAHQAWLMGDAIARTLVRLFITRRHLLEWVPAAQATIGPRLDLLGFYRRMAGAVVIGVLAVLVALLFGHGDVAPGGAVRCALDRLAGDRALDQPVSRGRRLSCPYRPPTPRPCG